MSVRSLAATLFLAASALAKTDLAGCTYTDTVVQPSGLPGYDAYASRIWYVPGTGELCDLLDCGGGRAPPRTDVPGCPLYSGTATYSPSYLDLKTKEVAAATSSAEAAATGGSTQVIVKATTAVATATTLATSVAVSESAPAVSTTAAPVVSSASSTASASKGLSAGTTGTPGRNGTSSGAHPSSTVPANGAAPTAAGILGSVLAVGVAALML